MPFKVEAERVQIESNVSNIERILTGAIGLYVLFNLWISPHSFIYESFKEKEIPFFTMVPGLLAGCVISLIAVYLVHRSIAKPKAEIIEVMNGGIRIKFGRYAFNDRGKNPDKDIFTNTFEFDSEEVRTIKLMAFSGGNELCVDKGKKRIRFGTALSEVEKEELYKHLKSTLNIPS